MKKKDRLVCHALDAVDKLILSGKADAKTLLEIIKESGVLKKPEEGGIDIIIEKIRKAVDYEN